MLFQYDGREFDTDKPIYMLGYCIKDKDSWFPVDISRDKTTRYPMYCKKLYVKSLTFADLNYKTVGGVLSIDFYTGRNNFYYTPTAKSVNIIGRSPKECMKLYKERGGIDGYAKSRI